MPRATPAERTGHLAAQRYFDRTFAREMVKVQPGEYFVSADGGAMTTVLGSCVSACIRDVALGVGGLNHFMLPGAERDAGAVSASARYGVFAMEVLINHLLKLGARRERLEAKLFGGGRVVASIIHSDVGARNVRFVRDYLATEGIPVVAEDLQDECSRKLVYFPDSGRAMVKRMSATAPVDALLRERIYQRRLLAAPVVGEVELFGAARMASVS
ncbi:chemoreceptor glutamine deamidase CheD [Denitromonas iodatirespirans]|uniref:Probable chemoreceptor glutamine deamidase CheD n=1 Tax=Denitromonas iodatirespirans TaxID=2795389 RepID=A0A944DG26_DENI1|nr:chemoreceptor glutamine deamidase CheD [Denitromonas iodatirespirans]MBT0963557.1 chemoreceptor glutamine deamidase CheD [Denitromonas iodatirespirans]